ncbi:MAG: YccF domain-containing protein [Azospirillum sp.]|nr:YccF domain-containing protein [Azospirillum sp.]
MSPVSLLLNLLWIVFGGLWMAVGWVIAGVIMALTLIGLPWARTAFGIAYYTLVPFGRTTINRDEYSGGGNFVAGPYGLVRNVVWFVLAGWWLALCHLFTAIMLAITLIGIPFAWAHLKLAALAVWPVGKVVVTTEEARQFQIPRPMRRVA